MKRPPTIPADFGYHRGYTGAFTRTRAPHALVNGLEVIKRQEEKGDVTPLGMSGIILGSIYDTELGFLYFIEWRDKPRMAVAVVGWKLYPPMVEPITDPKLAAQMDQLHGMAEAEIDTSDMPETTDWTKAVRGKFYRKPN